MENFPIANAEQVSFIMVSESDMDRFINSHYTHQSDYECVPDMEWSNDQYHLIKVRKAELNKWDFYVLENWLAGKFQSRILRVLLTDLANRDLIPECNLLIRCSW